MQHQEKHLIMGTAGHVDHGKTSLVKALTGIECDTHPQEKLRGITINLGFAHLALPSGYSISIIDVPGHKDFVNTMVSGAHGIDFVLMVISADSGIMPQTQEHLQIMQTLDIKKGIIALTKSDLVDDEIIELIQEEIREFVKDTFLENAPIIRVSSYTHQGIDTLLAAIDTCAHQIEQRPFGTVFRLFIDRIFSVSGFGTVVTGTVLSGKLSVNDSVFLLPTEKKLKIRRLERHGDETSTIEAGDRASLNLIGLNKDDFKKSMVLSDRIMSASTLVDAQLTLFQNSQTIGIWSEVIFILGTYEAKVRMHLLDKDSANPLDCVLVQFHLPKPCVICLGDHFIIRNTSKELSLGGGQILDSSPFNHRRRTTKLITLLTSRATGDLIQLITAEVRKSLKILSEVQLSEKLFVSESDIKKTIENEPLDPDIMVFTTKDSIFLMKTSDFSLYTDKISKNIELYHCRNPYEENGRTIKDLRALFSCESQKNIDECIHAVLAKLVEKKVLKRVENTWALQTHTVTLSAESKQQLNLLDTFIASFGLKVPLLSEIELFAQNMNLPVSELYHFLRYLTNTKRIYRIENDYLHADIVNPIRIRLLQTLKDKREGMKVAEFRDLIADNRKICLLLFSLFDSEAIIYRSGDNRFITAKGQQLIQNNPISCSTSEDLE